MKSTVINIRTYQIVLVIFMMVCAGVGVFCYQYYIQLQTTMRDESRGYLQEVSNRIGSNINRIINDNYAVLNTMASVLYNAKADAFQDVQPVVETQKSYWNYQDIMLIDEEGKAYNAYGKEVTLSSDIYLRNAVINRQESMSTSQMVNGQESIVFAIPIDMEIGGKKMSAMAASYEPATFEQVLSMTSFEGQAYSQIISKDGSIILRSGNDNATKMGYNLFTAIGNGKLDDGITMQQIQKEIANNHSGQISFTLDGVRNYMVYTPIEPEDWYLLTFVPVNVVNAKSDILLRITLILCGLITLVFAALIAILGYTFYKNKRKLEQIAYVDGVTKGNTIQRFYQLADEALTTTDRTHFALVYTNIEKFKVLNEQFGRNACDDLLAFFNEIVTVNLEQGEYMGRISADNFCMLLKYVDEPAILAKLEGWFATAEEYLDVNKPVWSLPIVEFGIYVIENDTLSFPQMIDRAKLSLRESPHAINSKMRYAVYNDDVRRRLFREKQLEDMMESAMKEHEFQVYLQPKYRVSDETVGGAEALTRWVSKSEGMIFPDEFIPLFEKNGFIVELDLWVFEEVCKLIHGWIESGLKPIKVSVNCSRVHLKDLYFLKRYEQVLKKYDIPRELLEIELTESVVMEDAQRLSQIIRDIQRIGLGCSMDDFGSGYSSLNLIQSIPVDTLKLDKIFFRNETVDSSRMESVVGSIITMAKALKMDTVAEGVEYPEQVIMLRRIGCDYIQGFVFSKPLPVPAFEALAFGGDHN